MDTNYGDSDLNKRAMTRANLLRKHNYLDMKKKKKKKS